MPDIFISYRRDDSAGSAGRLADSLESFFGSDNIFRDIEAVRPGEDFVKAIEHNLHSTDAVLVVIGKEWISAKHESGELRLKDPKDFVRLEIEAAFRYKRKVIPVLVENAAMPKPEDLPGSITPLAYLQAIEISDSRWDEDINRLVKVLAVNRKVSAKTGLWNRLTLETGKLKTFAFVLLLAAFLAFIIQRYLLEPDFSGNWYFIGGDYLLIKQEDGHVEIEHIDPAMQTIYDKGTGSIKGRRLQFDLVPIYTTKYRYRGDLSLSWDKTSLKGNLVEILSNETTPLELTRTNPAKK
jgi:TIR domain